MRKFAMKKNEHNNKKSRLVKTAFFIEPLWVHLKT